MKAKSFLAGVWLFVALQLADLVTTLYILAHEGREANPVLDAIIKCSLWDFVGFKLVLTYFVAGWMTRNYREGHRRGLLVSALVLADLAYIYVVACNVAGVLLYIRASWP